MIRKKWMLITISVLATSDVISQISGNSNDNTPIDISLKACLDSSENESTAGISSCVYRAEKSWDIEMNKYYQLLQGILSPEEKAKLKASQIKWLEFRDAEFITSNMIYIDMVGTMWRNVAAETEMVKQRTLELESYYDNLTVDR